MSKIRRILIKKAERAKLAQYLVRCGGRTTTIPPHLGCAPSGRSRKTKNFLILKKTAGGAGGSRKKLKGNFMVLLSALHSYEKGL